MAKSSNFIVSSVLKGSQPTEYSWELKRRAEEDRPVQPRYHGHRFSKAAASPVVGRSLLLNPKAVLRSVFLPLCSLRVITKNQKEAGIISERSSRHFFLCYLPALLPTVESAFSSYDLIITLISLHTVLKNSFWMKGTYHTSSARPEHTQLIRMCRIK